MLIDQGIKGIRVPSGQVFKEIAKVAGQIDYWNSIRSSKELMQNIVRQHIAYNHSGAPKHYKGLHPDEDPKIFNHVLSIFRAPIRRLKLLLKS